MKDYPIFLHFHSENQIAPIVTRRQPIWGATRPLEAALLAPIFRACQSAACQYGHAQAYTLAPVNQNHSHFRKTGAPYASKAAYTSVRQVDRGCSTLALFHAHQCYVVAAR